MTTPDTEVKPTTLQFEISFPVPVNISRSAHDLLVDAVGIICADYEAAHPDRIMWGAGFGSKMLCNPLMLSDDEPIPFSDDVEVIEVWERELFNDEKRRARLTNEWHSISTHPKGDRLFLAYCPPDPSFPDGRIMIWTGEMFARQNERTPDHLRFPATHWRPLPEPPRKSRVSA